MDMGQQRRKGDESDINIDMNKKREKRTSARVDGTVFLLNERGGRCRCCGCFMDGGEEGVKRDTHEGKDVK